LAVFGLDLTLSLANVDLAALLTVASLASLKPDVEILPFLTHLTFFENQNFLLFFSVGKV